MKSIIGRLLETANIVFITPFLTGNNACSPLPFIPNNTILLEETTDPGTTIISINATGSDKWEMALLRSGLVDGSIWNHLSSYFILKKVGNVYEMVVDQQPDLEAIFDHYTHQLTLEILPVNEFPPEFSESVLIQNVSELKVLYPNTTMFQDSKVGSVIYMLINHTVDMDVNPLGKELGSFGLSDYLKDAKHDGKDFFEMQDFSLGSIVLKQSLDFEALHSLNATRFFLNLSASDIHNWTTYTTLTINIVDVDDLPPEFYHPGCPTVSNKSRPCLVSYEAILSLNHVGFLTDIVPSFIRARDMDTLNSPVEYSLDIAPGETRGDQTLKSGIELWLSVDEFVGLTDIIVEITSSILSETC
ncbi:hypothetical protein Btru_036047 [Bulinus truncatus]|nr:hypothetical protein Btru_036047 [Bulinus truncatus]